METTESYQRDLLGLAIDANHHVDRLAERANELEDLVDKLATVLDRTVEGPDELDEGERHLVASAQRGAALRRRVRQDALARRADLEPNVHALPPPPGQ